MKLRAAPFGVVATIAFWAMVYGGLLLGFAAIWVRWAFGPIGVDEMIANLPSTHGGGVGDSSLVLSIAACLIAPLVVIGVAVAVLRRGTSGRRRPAIRWASGVAVVVVGALLLAFTVGVPQYAAAAMTNRTVEPYYVRPQATLSRPSPRNVITIYLESGEAAYQDASRFGSNLLASVDTATAGWHDYALRQYHGGGWTMAGMVSTQCGVPLKHLLSAGPASGTVSGYLSGATCLGDILAANGYTSAFLGGADSGFAGKGTLFTEHGYRIDKGLADWKAAGEGAPYLSAWGLADSHLMRQAESTVEELRASGNPFNLTLLTLDTHEPPGLFPDCTVPGAEPMSVAVTCSSRAVASFIDYLREHHVLDDTVVIVMGDHLKMLAPRGAYAAELASVPDRRVFMKVWSPDPVVFDRKDADQLSVLPTTLELLGFTVPQGRAGLGVSVVGGHDVAGTMLALPTAEYESLLEGPSTDLYRRLWGLG